MTVKLVFEFPSSKLNFHQQTLVFQTNILKFGRFSPINNLHFSFPVGCTRFSLNRRLVGTFSHWHNLDVWIRIKFIFYKGSTLYKVGYTGSLTISEQEKQLRKAKRDYYDAGLPLLCSWEQFRFNVVVSVGVGLVN